MKLNNLFVCVLFLTTLTTCTKFGKNVYIDGRVYNPITNEGIEGISLKIYRTQIDTKDPIGDSYKTLETTNTDSEGHYKMEHLSSIFNQVYVALNQGNFYLISSNYSYPIKKGKRNHIDFEMVPYGNLILDIQNINCGGSGDTMYFRKKWLGYTDFEGSYSTPRTGCYSYTSPSAFQVPMGTYVYETKVIRSGITTYVYDTIFVPATGVVTIDIDY